MNRWFKRLAEIEGEAADPPVVQSVQFVQKVGRVNGCDNRSVYMRELPYTPCPKGFDPQRWAILLDGTVGVARDWSVKAMSLGWSYDELFALREPFANASLQGAAWFIGDSTVTAVTADAITLRSESGSILRAYRKLVH